MDSRGPLSRVAPNVLVVQVSELGRNMAFPISCDFYTNLVFLLITFFSEMISTNISNWNCFVHHSQKEYTGINSKTHVRGGFSDRK